MREQKNYEILRENDLGCALVGDYFIPEIKLQPVEDRVLIGVSRKSLLLTGI